MALHYGRHAARALDVLLRVNVRCQCVMTSHRSPQSMSHTLISLLRHDVTTTKTDWGLGLVPRFQIQTLRFLVCLHS